MSGHHVTEKLSEYCLGELGGEQSRQVAEHLLGCLSCRQSYEEIKLGVSFASHLKPISPPPDLWEKIASQIDAPVERKPFRFGSWQAVSAVAAALIVAALVTLFYVWRPAREMVQTVPNPPASPLPVIKAPVPGPVGGTEPRELVRSSTGRPGSAAALNVLSLSGEPRVGELALSGTGQLKVGQVLQTDAQSRARIEIADIGNVEVAPNSNIRLLVTQSSEHRLNLSRGRVHARIVAPPRLFIVETPAATAVDLGCEYTLEVDESGGSVLKVASGYVSLEDKGYGAIVPAGAICVTRPGIGPGTPYFEDSTEGLQSALSRFDQARERDAALATVLREARRKDTLTLWNLLPRVRAGERGRVYDRMAELYGPPDGVTRAGILKLNAEMLEAYRRRLEWVW